jgi:glycosyltransferase involved in cell wall biosynthesis
VIPNGVDPALFRMQPWQPSKRPKLVYIGTLAMWQGLPTAIQAMPVILAAFPEAELHLIGPSKRRHQKRLVKQAAKLGLDDGTVCFPGPVSPEQMPVQLASASVCLAPLVYSDRNVAQGCCPIKVLEYAAAGRPIVASDLPVVRELFGEDEVLFFQPGDTAGLARQISYLLSHPQAAQVLAQRAAEKVRQAFTWQQSGERLLEVYAHLVETETPGRAPATTPALAPP